MLLFCWCLGCLGRGVARCFVVCCLLLLGYVVSLWVAGFEGFVLCGLIGLCKLLDLLLLTVVGCV